MYKDFLFLLQNLYMLDLFYEKYSGYLLKMDFVINEVNGNHCISQNTKNSHQNL